MYRALVKEFPTLHFQWKYWLDMDCGAGYVDELGDHRYRQGDKEDDWDWLAVDELADDFMAEDEESSGKSDTRTPPVDDEEFLSVLYEKREEKDKDSDSDAAPDGAD